ncbi:hypothetical protein HYW42_00260 [Candidatus Daviesbacteria bacterium]|nr:hypothetical protein [Candidatus Daviesbacteria bacterium]
MNLLDQEKPPIFFKQLALLDPKESSSLSRAPIRARLESPTFISPIRRTDGWCRDCEVGFNPLVYQVHALIQAQHFHRTSGGIYCWRAGQVENIQNITPPGWIALVSPQGDISYDSECSGGLTPCRSEAVRVDRMLGFCNECSIPKPSSGVYKEIKEGLAVLSLWGNDGLLSPLCGLEKHPKYEPKVRLGFHIGEDGHIGFYYP